MYALVNLGKIISGPKEWDRAFFQDVLNRNGIEGKKLSKEIPDELPFIINDNAKIAKVEIRKNDINTLVQYHRGPIWEFQNDIVIANYETLELPLEFAKSNYKTLVTSKRYDKEVSGTKITIKNKEVSLDTSREGRNIFVQKYILMKDGDTVNWKFPEGWLTLTKSELGLVVSAGEAHIQAAFDWEKDLTDQINAATSIQDLIDLEKFLN